MALDAECGSPLITSDAAPVSKPADCDGKRARGSLTMAGEAAIIASP